jgi:hypothetical protein
VVIDVLVAFIGSVMRVWVFKSFVGQVKIKGGLETEASSICQ